MNQDQHISILLQIRKDTAKMANHIDRVEKHISFVEKVISIFFPSLQQTKQKDDFDILSAVV